MASVPNGRLTFDSKGNLFGTASGGGNGFNGTVFELSQLNGTWTETVLYNFTGGSAGGNPFNGVVFDSHGNLYGAAGGGAYGFGLIFELVPSANGTWTEKVLHNFTDNLGGTAPNGPLVFDQAGDIYGASAEGGALDYGLVFELIPGANGKWTEKSSARISGRIRREFSYRVGFGCGGKSLRRRVLHRL